jgi:hypothetical protein
MSSKGSTLLIEGLKPQESFIVNLPEKISTFFIQAIVFTGWSLASTLKWLDIPFIAP